MNQILLNKTTTTSIKGIAILLVIIAHVGHVGFGIRLLVPLGCFGVSVFLILSGYGLMESYSRNGLKDFWRKRVLRVLLPYLIWICFYSIYLLISHKPITSHDIRYWFVEYIIIWYVAFYYIMKFCPYYKWSLFLVIAILILLIKPCLQAQQSLSFLIGMLLSYYKNRIIGIKAPTLLLIGCLFLFIGLAAFGVRQWIVISDNGIIITGMSDFLITKNIDDGDYATKIIQIVTKLPISLFIIILLNFIHIEKNRLSYIIGLASYELYLVHMSFYQYISNSVLNLLLFTIKTIVLSYLLYRCDKNLSRYVCNS